MSEPKNASRLWWVLIVAIVVFATLTNVRGIEVPFFPRSSTEAVVWGVVFAVNSLAALAFGWFTGRNRWFVAGGFCLVWLMAVVRVVPAA